ncbi:hypothetical protein BC830DRAFT_1158847 [Chytriomyces sp. MP71]|nr:hypothetical protein BC830DRAFT_1158847 [Chytriomyces sp. MP71]
MIPPAKLNNSCNALVAGALRRMNAVGAEGASWALGINVLVLWQWVFGRDAFNAPIDYGFDSANTIDGSNIFNETHECNVLGLAPVSLPVAVKAALAGVPLPTFAARCDPAGTRVAYSIDVSAEVVAISDALVDARGCVSVRVALVQPPYQTLVDRGGHLCFQSTTQFTGFANTQSAVIYIRVYLSSLAQHQIGICFNSILASIKPLDTPFLPLEIAKLYILNILPIFLNSISHDAASHCLRNLFTQLPPILDPNDTSLLMQLQNELESLSNMTIWASLPLFGGIRSISLNILYREIRQFLCLADSVSMLDITNMKLIFSQATGIDLKSLKFLETAFECILDGIFALQSLNPQEGIPDITGMKFPGTLDTQKVPENMPLVPAHLPYLECQGPGLILQHQDIPHQAVQNQHQLQQHGSELTQDEGSPIVSSLQPPIASKMRLYPTPQETPLPNHLKDLKQVVLKSVSDVGIVRASAAFNLPVLKVRAWCFDPAEIAKFYTTGAIDSLIQGPSVGSQDPPGTIYSLFCSHSLQPTAITNFQVEANNSVSALFIFPCNANEVKDEATTQGDELAYVRTYIASMDLRILYEFESSLEGATRVGFERVAQNIRSSINSGEELSFVHSLAFDILTMAYRTFEMPGRGLMVEQAGQATSQTYRQLLETLFDAVARDSQVENMINTLMLFVEQAL